MESPLSGRIRDDTGEKVIWKWRDVSSFSYQELALGYWSRMGSESSLPMESCRKASRSKEKHDKRYTVKNMSLPSRGKAILKSAQVKRTA